MKAIETITGPVSVLMRDDVDTDQIIPKQFLKRVERTGFGEFLFYDWAKEDGWDLPVNQILVTGRNFGCGSSREHAPWALEDYGFRVVIASSLRGHLQVQLHQDRHAARAADRRGRASRSPTPAPPRSTSPPRRSAGRSTASCAPRPSTSTRRSSTACSTASTTSRSPSSRSPRSTPTRRTRALRPGDHRPVAASSPPARRCRSRTTATQSSRRRTPHVPPLGGRCHGRRAGRRAERRRRLGARVQRHGPSRRPGLHRRRPVHRQLRLHQPAARPTSARPRTAAAPARRPTPTAARRPRCRSARRSRSPARASPARWPTTRGSRCRPAARPTRRPAPTTTWR